MGVSMVLDNALVAILAEKIVHARKLYGADSAYVIGLFTGFEWLLEGVEGGEEAKQLLRNRVLEYESGKAVKPTEQIPVEREEAALPENSWIKGTVKWFNNDKGYGFISTDGNIDVFVHWRDISSWDRSIGQGEEVEFMVTKTAKGFQAVNVMKTDQKEGEGTRPEEGFDEPEIEAEAATANGGEEEFSTSNSRPAEVEGEAEEVGPETPPKPEEADSGLENIDDEERTDL